VTVDTELRQLRRVRWGVRFTLALGISASLAANVLHAHHLLIDQIIAGWPPVAVFASIEAIARVPIRKRWLAIVRMAGLGFVAGIAFWVSYWHMASVAATHGENGSKYLLPLSVDGLVLVSSISLVELTGQISAAETAARAAAAVPTVSAAAAAAASGAPIAPPPGDVAPAGAVSSSPAVVARQPMPGGQSPAQPAAQSAARDSVEAAAAPVAVALAVPAVAGNGTTAAQDGHAHLLDTDADDADPDDTDANDIDPDDPPREVGVPGGRSPGVALVASTDPPGTETGVGADGGPPANTADAVAWWRAHRPNMPVREICAKVGRSERTVRRILDGLSPRPVPVGDDAGDRAADADGPRPRINGATVTPLADSVTSG
jgi:hypothetical protein